jgi:hypothetical protein
MDHIENAMHWIMVGVGMMFFVSIASFIGLIAWICYLTEQLHKLRRPPEVLRDANGRKLKERV